MRTLVATFGHGDSDNVLMAMRRLPYDRLVLIGERGEEPSGLSDIRRVESMTGNEVQFVQVDTTRFMDLVDEVCEVVSGLSGGRGEVAMNISGGTKLLADAALFAAFRLGVPAYHVTDRVVRLPVMKGVTARNRFTPLQSQFIAHLAEPSTIPDLVKAMPPHNKQSVERVMRELRRVGLVSARLESARVAVSLTDEGHEIRRALAASESWDA